MSILRVMQNSFNSGILSPETSSRQDLEKYASGCRDLLNCVVQAHGGVSRRPGQRFICSVGSPVERGGSFHCGRLVPFEYSSTQTCVLLFLDRRMLIFESGGVIIENDAPKEVATPYAIEDLGQLEFNQSADVMWFAHPKYSLRKLTRTVENGVAVWTWTEETFAPVIAAPTGVTATKMTQGDGAESFVSTTKDTHTIHYKVSAENEDGAESLPSAAVEVKYHKWIEDCYVRVAWTAVPGATKYHVYKEDTGYFGYIGTVDADSLPTGASMAAPAFKDNNIEPDVSSSPPEANDPFEDGNHPACVTIFQQRLVIAGGTAKPHTLWLSRSGNLDSFDTHEPDQDDDAIEAILDSSKVNAVRHLAVLSDLVVFTAGAEWSVSGSSGKAVAPAKTSADPMSFWGCGDLPPITCGSSLLWVLASGKTVRDLYYKQDAGFAGGNLTLLVPHLLRSKLVSWAYQKSPFDTVWAVREDGDLLSLTYLLEADVIAWSRHATAGKYRSVAAVRNGGGDDDVYFLVERDGELFVEYQERWEAADGRNKANFLDASLVYHGEATTTVSGLEHLAGRMVAALADGSAVMNLTVSGDGKVDLPFAASDICVGLPYKMRIETLDPAVDSRNGTSSGLKKRLVAASVKTLDSAEYDVGSADGGVLSAARPVPQSKLGRPPELYSGFFRVAVGGAWRDSLSVAVEQVAPLPLTVQAIVIDMEVGS